jgi:hypothetical protein
LVRAMSSMVLTCRMKDLLTLGSSGWECYEMVFLSVAIISALEVSSLLSVMSDLASS